METRYFRRTKEKIASGDVLGRAMTAEERHYESVVTGAQSPLTLLMQETSFLGE